MRGIISRAVTCSGVGEKIYFLFVHSSTKPMLHVPPMTLVLAAIPCISRTVQEFARSNTRIEAPLNSRAAKEVLRILGVSERYEEPLQVLLHSHHSLVTSTI
jgi:hypothetical protein